MRVNIVYLVDHSLEGIFAALFFAGLPTLIAAVFGYQVDIRAVIAFTLISGIVLGVGTSSDDENELQVSLCLAFVLSVFLCLVWGIIDLLGVLIGIPTIVATVLLINTLGAVYDDIKPVEIVLSLACVLVVGAGTLKWFGTLDASRVIAVSVIGFLSFSFCFIALKRNGHR